MLIKCPECGKEVSDKASQCIHCGFPFKEEKSTTIAIILMRLISLSQQLFEVTYESIYCSTFIF